MSKITHFSKPLVQNLRIELNTLLAEFANKHGITASLGNARFTPSNVNWKFTLVSPGAGTSDGSTPTGDIYALNFLNKCHLYGMKKDDLNKTILLRGKLNKIVGLNPRSYKYPIICENRNGTRYIYSDTEVLNALNNMR